MESFDATHSLASPVLDDTYGDFAPPPPLAPAPSGRTHCPIRAANEQLSEREREVIKSIAHGYSNKQIAIRLLVSVKTVETYKSRAMEKLGLYDRTDIVRFAVGQGWFDELRPRPDAT